MKQRLHFSIMVGALKVECRDYGWSYAKIYVYEPRSGFWSWLSAWRLVFMAGGGSWSQYSTDAERATRETPEMWAEKAGSEYLAYKTSWARRVTTGAQS